MRSGKLESLRERQRDKEREGTGGKDEKKKKSVQEKYLPQE